MGVAFVVEESRHLLVIDGSAAQGPMKGEPLRRTAPYFVHPRFTRNGPLRQTVAAARSVEDKQGKHDDDEDNCFRSAGSRLTRVSGVGSQRRCMRGRSIPGGMRRSAWRSRRSSRLRLRLSWRSCCAACLWRPLLLARRRSRLPLTGYYRTSAGELALRPHLPTSSQQPNGAVMWPLGSGTFTPALQFGRAIHPFYRVNGRGCVRWLSQTPRRPRRAEGGSGANPRPPPAGA
jgi:hypothetical protein